jgi:hypothetical protein
MRLRSFTVEGYKAFAEEAMVELRPLTLFYGYNHVGKSALLRVLPLLAESVGALSGPLDLQSEAVRDASFGSLVSQLADRPTIRFGLDWEAPAGRLRSLDLEIRGQLRRQLVDRLRASLAGDESPLELIWIPEDVQALNRRYRCLLGEVASEHELVFNGLLPSLPSENGRNDRLVRLLQEIRSTLLTWRSQVHWLSALRKPPPRYPELKATPDRIASDGDGAAKILAADHLGDRALVAQVSDWFRQAMGYSLTMKVDSRSDSDPFALMLSPAENPLVRVPLLDSGEGMGQVFPVFVLAALAKLGQLGKTPLLAIEHPELHLQPKVHADLASVFCELASMDSPPQMVVETHSENFMLRVQLEIVRGNLPADRVLVYWVRQDPDGRAIVKPIEIDDLAILQGWPPGVFATASEQGGEIIMERRRSQA